MEDDLSLLAKDTPELLFKWEMAGGDNFLPIEVFEQMINSPEEGGSSKMQEKTRRDMTVFVIPNTTMGKFSRYMFQVDPNDAHWRDRLTKEVYYSMQKYHPKKGYSSVTLQFNNEDLNDGDHARATYSAAPLNEAIKAAPAYGFNQLANVVTSSSNRRAVTPEERAKERFADYREACSAKLAAQIKAKFGDRPPLRSDLKRVVISALHGGDMMSKIKSAGINKHKVQVSSAISSDICSSVQRVDTARMKRLGVDLEMANKTAIFGSQAWDCVKSWFSAALDKAKPADENISVSHSDYSDAEDERSYRRNFNPSMTRAMPTVHSVSYTAATSSPAVAASPAPAKQVAAQRGVYNLRQITKNDLDANKQRRTVYLYPIEEGTKRVQAERKTLTLYPIQRTQRVQAQRKPRAADQEEEICLVPIQPRSEQKEQCRPVAATEPTINLIPLEDEEETLSAPSRLGQPITFSLINASNRRVNLSCDGISQELNMAKFVGPIKVSKGAQIDGKEIGAEFDGTTAIYDGAKLIKAEKKAQPGQTAMRFSNLCKDASMNCQVKSHLGATTMLGSSYSGVGSGSYTITISGNRGAAKVDKRVAQQGNSYTIYAVPYGDRNAIVMAADCENVNNELVKQMGNVMGKEGHMFVGKDRNFGHVIRSGLRMTHSSDETSRHVVGDGRVFDVTERRNGVYDKNESIKTVTAMWHHPANPKLTVVEYDGHSSDLPVESK